MNRRFLALLGVPVFTLVIVFLVFFSVKPEKRSALRIGYVGNSTSHVWSGTYLELDGVMEKVLSPKEDELSVSITTESGSISIRIEDMQGNKLYSGNGLSTCDFRVKTDGKVRIHVEGVHHSGGFLFE